MGARIEAVLVLGAGGVLGRRVARLLAAGLPGARVVPASRRGPAALGPGARSADVRDAASLARALAGIDLVVNAVGPYTYDPGPLAEACVAAGAHYLDLAEDAAFLAALRGAAQRAGAASAGVAFVPGCSTTPGLVELLAQGFARIDGLAAVDAWLSLGTRNPLSAALLQGLLRPLGRPAPDGGRWFDAVVWHRADGRVLAFGRYPSGLPGERVRAGGCEVPLRFHAGFDRAALDARAAPSGPAPRRRFGRAARRVSPGPCSRPRASAASSARRGACCASRRAAQAGRSPPRSRWWRSARGSTFRRRRPSGPPAPSAPRRGRGVLRLADLVSRSDALAGLAALGCAVREDLHSGA